jgi:transcriptional regulator with XRE-family HTH domain
VSRTLAEQIAERVRAQMTEKSISGVRLAKQMGTTQQYLSRRLTGEVDFRSADLERIAEILDVPVSIFLRGDTEAVAS